MFYMSMEMFLFFLFFHFRIHSSSIEFLRDVHRDRGRYIEEGNNLGNMTFYIHRLNSKSI